MHPLLRLVLLAPPTLRPLPHLAIRHLTVPPRKFPSYVDSSKVPELREADLEESFIHGSGPGGSKVNKAVNCVFLKHLPTGLSVKVHDHRLREKNQVQARYRLQDKLDRHVNGDSCVDHQVYLYKLAKRKKAEAKAAKLREQKKALKLLAEERNSSGE